MKNVVRRAYNRLIKEPSFFCYFLLFFGSILCFGFVYSFMPENHGVVPKESTTFWSDVFHGIYFSVVTITSLGYGDLRPEGFSRLLAGMQVVFGLTLIGLMITKLTSTRVSHFVSSLYTSDVQRNLTKYSLNFSTDSDNIRGAFEELALHYQKFLVPTESINSSNLEVEKLSNSDVENAKSRFRSSIASLKNRTREFHDYLFEVTDRGKYLQLINKINLIDLVSTISSALSVINQSIIVLYPFQKSKSSLAGVPIQHLSDIATMQERANTLISENCQNDEISRMCTEIDDLCQNISVALVRVPSSEQPDQMFRGSEPIEVSETENNENNGEPK